MTPRAGRPDDGRADAGFSLVAVVAGMTIMLIMMGAAMPSWKYVVQNEREQELYFRGDQIAAAIERYQKKNGGAPPASLEVLVKGRFLRKAYDDPMTRDGKWKFITPGEITPVRGILGRPPGFPGASPIPSPTSPPSPRESGSGISVPFVGVASTSTEESLRVMNGQGHYHEWLFIAGRPRFLGRGAPDLLAGSAGVAPKPGVSPKPEPLKGPGQAR